jgi:hypothetical protein
VNADDVLSYGLFVDNMLGDMISWNGENGQVFGSACNLSSDITQKTFVDQGYYAYKVADGVENHMSYGAGVYNNAKGITVSSAIKTPKTSGVQFYNTLISDKSGSSTITHAVDNSGSSASRGGHAFLCGTNVSTSSTDDMLIL